MAFCDLIVAFAGVLDHDQASVGARTAISADATHSQVDVPELIEHVRVPDGISPVNLGAWNDDPIVIQAIKEKAETVMGV